MLKVIVGDRLKAEKGEDKNTLPFAAKGTIETERTKGDVTVLVEATEDGGVTLVVHPRQASGIGPYKVKAYVSGATAALPRVAAPTEEDKDATVPGELKAGVELVFTDVVIVPKDAPEPKEQNTF